MEHFPLIVAALGAGLNAAISIHILWRFRRPFANDIQKIYEDRDGIATDESHKHYSASIRITKSLITAVWAAGLLVSLATATSRTLRTESTQVTEAWLAFSNWVGHEMLFLR